ncbi:hypothetical protein SCLCIDRAFT_18213 [Scleroderma citrinum Foug A]|uniref:SUI1 domain-containing protein n=1 Tax=Scleroderma citrinum Foug A TaxID=1036808 RepID=A0A0C3D850_9AGAM|nr:hypothetical protein SCLCIDRAFT_18213 [Scleroderma citrinum Foug A]
MFKKPLSNLKTSAPLRSSDRRKLKQRIIETYGVSSEIGDILVPEGLMSQKILTYTNERGVAYSSPDGDPLWFSVGEGEDNPIPTVYTLWKKYDLLPCISSPAAAIPFLIGGVDLTIPGGDPPGIVEIEVAGEAMKGMELKTGADPASVQDLPDADVDKVDGKDIERSDLEAKVGSPPSAAPKTRVQPEAQLSKEEVSDMLHAAVLQAIESTVKSLSPSSFPIPAGTFYSLYILPFRPAFVRQSQVGTVSGNDGNSPTITYPAIDIKHSSYKSLAAFLKDLDKRGILTVKDMKPEPLVLKVSASHSDVTSHKLYTSLRDVHLKEEDEKKRAEEERSRVKEMKVRELWKPDAASGSGRFFSEGGFDTSALYTHTELKATVIKHITTRQLVNVHDRSRVNITQDDLLLGTVARKNESHKNLKSLKLEEVVQRLSEKMEIWHEICAEDKEPVLKKGQLKPISVGVKTSKGARASKGRGESKGTRASKGMRLSKGGRASTFIYGFEPFFIEGEMMAEELRHICAGSTSVSSMPGEGVGLKVLVQGKQINAATEFLLSKGVPNKWIEVTEPEKK